MKNETQIELMKKSGEILANCHRELKSFIKPGITPLQIDSFVEEFLIKNNSIPAQKGFHGFPYAICSSVNEVICHGFPNDKPLANGDLITVDIVVDYQGGLTDSAWTYAVGEVSEEKKRLMLITEKALYKGIEQAIAGNYIGDIGYAIETYIQSQGLGLIKEFGGHGIGKEIHEEPIIPNFGKPRTGELLVEGMVICIEPMVNSGAGQLFANDVEWLYKSADGSPSAHYEHTVLITKGKPIILTRQ